MTLLSSEKGWEPSWQNEEKNTSRITNIFNFSSKHHTSYSIFKVTSVNRRLANVMWAWT